jgi:hypothetical protein
MQDGDHRGDERLEHGDVVFVVDVNVLGDLSKSPATPNKVTQILLSIPPSLLVLESPPKSGMATNLRVVILTSPLSASLRPFLKMPNMVPSSDWRQSATVSRRAKRMNMPISRCED